MAGPHSSIGYPPPGRARRFLMKLFASEFGAWAWGGVLVGFAGNALLMWGLA